ncbi:MAG: MFS transporter [Chloroflexi bacterium]|nr:MFS transporter [Chloroflexota bacterium]
MSSDHPTITSHRTFYGWWIVLLAFLGGIMGRIDLWVFGLFVVPIQDDLGWSRMAITGAVTVSLVSQGIAGPLLGPLMDRRNGSRLLMVAGGLLGGAALMAAGMSRSLVQFYLAYGLVFGIVGVTYGELMSNVMVPKWFIRRRGRAVALAALGYPMAAPTLVPAIQLVIAHWGWRSGFWALGLATWLLVVPLAAWKMRRAPEDLGLHPDGDPQPRPGPTVFGASHDTSWPWHLAARTPTLWLLVAALSLATAAVSAVSVHRIPYLQDAGLPAAVAAAVITVSGTSAIVTKMGWGFLIERLPVRYVLVGCFAALTGGVLVMLSITSAPMAFLWALWWGGTVSGLVPLQSVVFATYYGRGFLGGIRGRVQPPVLLAQALAPLLPAFIHDRSGSYGLAFWVFFAALAASVFLFFLARPPGAPHIARASPASSPQ